MTKRVEKVIIGCREYTQFIPYPKTVRDGTYRCISCGQIDEEEYHTLTCEEAMRHQGFIK